ncbi:hypothetical protein [Mycolicibacterium sp. XJ879]
MQALVVMVKMRTMRPMNIRKPLRFLTIAHFEGLADDTFAVIPLLFGCFAVLIRRVASETNPALRLLHICHRR